MIDDPFNKKRFTWTDLDNKLHRLCAEIEEDCAAKFKRKPHEAFKGVYGIPRGGVRLGQMLNEYATGNPEDPVLIVDDVYTTGTSIREFIEENYKGQEIFCWVVFARNRIYKRHIKALFQMPLKK